MTLVDDHLLVVVTCNSHVLYATDTEGSFMVERALQIAEACVEDMEEYTGYMHKHFKASQVKMKPKDILENIFYFRVCSYTEQIALVNHLDKFISENKNVGTKYLNSISYIH